MITREISPVKRCVIAGSVDVGKSTLIGRMLYDAHLVYRDQIDALKKTSALDGGIDFSFLTDGLGIEREQRITVDVAYRYFSKGKNKYILADVPGHEQYTRNMITGASQSDIAIIVLDASRGLDIQSRRHLHILSLLRIFPLIIVINKMDAVQYSRDVYEQLRNEIRALFSEHEQADIHVIPSCAVTGGMLFQKDTKLSHLSDTSLFELLESIDSKKVPHESGTIMRIQSVIKDEGTRWYLGSVSGSVSVGDPVVVCPSNIETRVADIIHGFDHVSSVTDTYGAVSLSDYVDASRGDIITSNREHALARAQLFSTMLFWFDATPCEKGRSYILSCGIKKTRCIIENILTRRDNDNFTDESCDSLTINDIGTATIRTLDEMVFLNFYSNKHFGSFILIEECTNQTVAGGIIV